MQTEASHLGRSDNLSVLVVDDDLNTAADLAALFRREGHRVRVVPDGDSAHRAALHQPPDAVLFLGADSDPWAAASHLRMKPGEKQPFLIALTDGVGKEALCRPPHDGIDLHLAKPVSAELLGTDLRRFHRVIMPTAV